MAITDELRRYASYAATDRFKQSMLAIADRIDKEHERLMEERADEYHKLRVYAEDCCVELPKDADGEYIRVGDVMEWPTTGETFEVVGIGDGTLFYVEDGSACADWTGASTKHHHHAPTVEDVLREFVHAILNQKPEFREENIAEYASKLRLAGDAE